MADSHDLLAHAYATLDLPPWSSKRETTRQYKKLVKRWHPDQYANDPQGQAEAAQRMREINRAYAVIQEARRNGRIPRATPVTASNREPRQRSRFFGQRLSEADLDDIADAIGTPSYFGILARYAFWAGGITYGLLLLMWSGNRRGGPPNKWNFVAGILLLCIVAAHFVRTMWRKSD